MSRFSFIDILLPFVFSSVPFFFFHCYFVLSLLASPLYSINSHCTKTKLHTFFFLPSPLYSINSHSNRTMLHTFFLLPSPLSRRDLSSHFSHTPHETAPFSLPYLPAPCRFFDSAVLSPYQDITRQDEAHQSRLRALQDQLDDLHRMLKNAESQALKVKKDNETLKHNNTTC